MFTWLRQLFRRNASSSPALEEFARMLHAARLAAARADAQLEMAREDGAAWERLAELEDAAELARQDLAIGESEWRRLLSVARAHGLDISHFEPLAVDPIAVRAELEVEAALE
jgi:hypothetical protein